MKRPFAGLLLFLAVLLIGCAAILGYSSEYDNVAKASAELMLESIESDRKHLGHYPAKVEMNQTKILGVLPGAKLRYLEAGASCSVYYEQWPFGPKAFKNCGGGAWYYEE